MSFILAWKALLRFTLKQRMVIFLIEFFILIINNLVSLNLHLRIYIFMLSLSCYTLGSKYLKFKMIRLNNKF